MMEENEHVQSENMRLLMEIFKLKVHLEEIYNQKGPDTPEYITLSIKLNLLTKEYFEEKMLSLIDVSKDNLTDIWNRNGFKHVDTIEASQKLDELIVKYQKLKQVGVGV